MMEVSGRQKSGSADACRTGQRVLAHIACTLRCANDMPLPVFQGKRVVMESEWKAMRRLCPDDAGSMIASRRWFIR
ncbi:hypothetical protein [Caballeronia ptereochthonis]|uniref:hypothetical protein n=1 Tax=Caballeronia ptereochthonis TaxID=1777144 RepID=UPI001357E87C|nr:hypothetical protein [Caballeronia ptereochthonis]